MSVTTTNVFSLYAATGASNVFNIGFYAQLSSWLLVKVDDVSVPFTAVLNTDQDATPGGTVTVTGPLLGVGQAVRVERHTPLTQLDAFQPYTPFPAQIVEFDFDKAVCIMQELAYAISLITIPAISGATAGQYLSNNGANLLWADPIPKPYLPGGFLTASTPTALAWGAGGGGGGGGIAVIGPVTTPSAFGAIISGVGANVLQLTEADPTRPGVVNFSTQHFGGLKTLDDPITSPYDVRRFGAVPNDPTNNLATAYYACLASQPGGVVSSPIFNITGNSPPAKVYIPPGIWYTDQPLCGPGLKVGETTIQGGGPNLTVIVPGIGGPGTPGNVQSFSGPVMYTMGGMTAAQMTGPNIPVFGAPLVGGVGQSFTLHDAFDGPNRCLRLHDSFPWGSWIGDFAYRITNFSIQLWAQAGGSLVGWGEKGIIGSRGPDVWQTRTPLPTSDIAFAIVAVSNGAVLTFRAYLTTNPDYDSLINMQQTGTVHIINSLGSYAPGTVLHHEIDYDGSHFDYYINGINQGHIVATGPIIRCPWEGVTIGGQGPEFVESPQLVAPIEGAIDSVRLSNIARHTGGAPFAPPVAKYTWDANTMALYNWDQPFPTATYGAQTITLPFVAGQCLTQIEPIPNGTLVGPVPHFIRFTGPQVSPDMCYQDFAISGWRSCSGIVAAYADRGEYSNLWITNTSQFGLAILTGVSFYSNAKYISHFDNIGTGIQFFGDLFRSNSQQCGIAINIASGKVIGGNYQPTFNSYAGLVINDGSFPTEIAYFSLDDEVWAFGRQIGGGVIMGNPRNVFLHDNFWGSAGGVSAPFTYLKINADSRVTHQNDTFSPDRTADIPCSAIHWKGSGLPLGRILLDNCSINDFRTPQLPVSNVPGWVSVKYASQASVQTGLSTADEQANNLAGEFLVNGDFAYGGPRFIAHEIDGNYEVLITPLTSLGGVPAAGSNRVTSVSTRANGFTAFFEAAPGGIVENIYSYMIIRKPSPAEFFSYLPAIPSAVTNPLNVIDANLPFGVGFTLVPVGVTAFGWQTVAAQTIVEAGVTVDVGNWWEVGFEPSMGTLRVAVGADVVDLDSHVIDGNFCSIFNPGVHNIAMAYNGPQPVAIYFNGFGPLYLGGAATFVGIQQTPIYIGERFDLSQPLTTATLKNLKISSVPTKVISDDSGIGPGLQAQSAFFGDVSVMGLGSTVPLGGWATQLANTRYGTPANGGCYYWLGGRVQGSVLTSGFGTYVDIFKPWLGAITAPELVNFCLYPGYSDIYAGTSAVTIFATLTNILEGEKANSTFIPPTSFTTPSDLRPIILGRVPSSGSANYVLNGRAFVVPFIVDDHTTVLGLCAQIAADAPSAALFVGTAYQDPNTLGWDLQVQTILPGSAGRAYVMSTDGGGGSFMYGDIGGGVPGTGLSCGFIGGGDTTCVVAGVTFPANFRTNANTTVNDLIALIAANVTVNALVVCTLVGGQMLCEARNAGAAGNLITISGNATDTPVIGNPWSTPLTLLGGSNGMVGNVPNIIFCTCPPIDGGFGVTAPMVAQLNALNVLINAYVGVGVTVVDTWTFLHNPALPNELLPVYGGPSTALNDAGHEALFSYLSQYLPGDGGGTPPSALSYATNPAVYVSGAPIAANNTTVTGAVGRYSVYPPLPAGLALNRATGSITGTPTTPTGIATYVIWAHNTAGSTFVNLPITIT